MNSTISFSQNNYNKGDYYVLDTIVVSGLKIFSDITVVAYSGLRKGQNIQVPGEEISNLLKKLWNLELFSDVNIFISDISGKSATLEISVDELPTLNNYKITGIKKGQSETIIDETELREGKRLSESFLTNTKNYIENKFKKNGYLNTTVNLITSPDSIGSNKLNLIVDVNKGERIKINNISFNGNEIFKSPRLKSKLKKTKKKSLLRFWKKSKLIPDDFEADKENLISYYKEKGYRDARITYDTIIKNDEKTIDIVLDLDEGNQYYFGKINYVGNSSFSDYQLDQILGIAEGDSYNGVLLK